MARSAVVRAGCAMCAVAAALLAAAAGNDLYFTGFPDSHLTDYDKAAELPKRILMWGEWAFALFFVVLAAWPINPRNRVVGLIVGFVALVVVAVIQWVGIPWYFITHRGLDNGIGG